MPRVEVAGDWSRGDWMQTFTGRCFWPMDPRPEDVFIEDIAHALSMTCRYGGHSKKFYSVAEHSILVSHLVPRRVALWGLLHDAAEAYSADIPKPLKRHLTEWAPIEDRIMRAVCLRFGLPEQEPPEVKEMDGAILEDERRALMAPCDRPWTWRKPAGVTIHGYSPAEAKRLFIHQFRFLTSKPDFRDIPVGFRG